MQPIHREMKVDYIYRVIESNDLKDFEKELNSYMKMYPNTTVVNYQHGRFEERDGCVYAYYNALVCRCEAV